MQRGKFPYAHLDLMVTGSGETYLSEINLRGGIKGAVITSQEYMEKIDAIHAAFARQAFCSQKTALTGRNNQA